MGTSHCLQVPSQDLHVRAGKSITHDTQVLSQVTSPVLHHVQSSKKVLSQENQVPSKVSRRESHVKSQASTLKSLDKLQVQTYIKSNLRKASPKCQDKSQIKSQASTLQSWVKLQVQSHVKTDSPKSQIKSQVNSQMKKGNPKSRLVNPKYSLKSWHSSSRSSFKFNTQCQVKSLRQVQSLVSGLEWRSKYQVRTGKPRVKPQVKPPLSGLQS